MDEETFGSNDALRMMFELAHEVSSWLAKVRTEAAPLHGESIRPFASHTYRLSLAMRFLNSGTTYEDVARVLGDTVATIETHYSELGITPSFRKVRTPNHHKVAVHASRGTDSRLVADVPGFEPGFSA